jgi:glycosyltransferase involved in cell wall biosynthesis
MGVILSCFARMGGVGLSNVLFHTARASYRSGLLDKAICFGNRQSEIPDRHVRTIRFQPIKVFSFLKARYYYTLKRMTLDRRCASYIERHGCTVFHGWTTSSVESLHAARKIGAKTIVERPSPYPTTWERLLREEHERWGIPFPADRGFRSLRRIDASYREEKVAPVEFDLADRVVVQSEFSANTFMEAGIPREKLFLLPRGVDLAAYSPLSRERSGPFRVIFIGSVCLRKGFLDLAHAWTKLGLPDAELWAVGSLHDEIASLLLPYRDHSAIRFFGHLNEGVIDLLRQSDVFVLPTLVEGSAKTTYEAMASGLPVITTPHAGSVVRDGKDGFIVPPRNPEALVERILYLYKNKEAARAMGQSARRQVENFSWDAFEDRVAFLHRELSGHGEKG